MAKSKLITKINEEISLCGDKEQYIIKFCKGTKPTYWYFPSLDMCFTEIFTYLNLKNLTTGKEKNMEQVVKIIKETREEMMDIMKPFVDIDIER